MSLTPPLDAEVDRVYRALPSDSRWRRARGGELPPLADRRQAMAADSLTDDELRHGGAIEFEERSIVGPADAPAIPTLILRPADRTGPRPVLYFLHGSGLIMPGNRTMLTAEELGWVAGLGAVMISIDYRVAPEHRHPAPVEDAYAGLVWTATHADELGLDADRLVVVGASAGGGLAAGTALLARDRHGPPISHQVLISPMLDDRGVTVSSGYDSVVWDAAANRAGWSALLGDDPAGPDVNGYAAPARATDLTDLPPSYLDCGSTEVFRDEAVDYADRLARAGVPVELHIWAGAAHYSHRFAPDAEVSRAAMATRTSYLRRALQTDPESERP